MLAANTERRIPVAGTTGISASAAIAALNFTVVTPVADGFVTVYECGSVPVASTVNFRAGEVVPELHVRHAVRRRRVLPLVGQPPTSSSTASAGRAGTAGLRGLQPSRVLDTRNNTWSIGPAQSGQTLRAPRRRTRRRAERRRGRAAHDHRRQHHRRRIRHGLAVRRGDADGIRPQPVGRHGPFEPGARQAVGGRRRGVPAPDAVQRLVDHADRRCRRLDAGRADPWPGAAAPDPRPRRRRSRRRNAREVHDAAGRRRAPERGRVRGPGRAARPRSAPSTLPYNNTRSGTSTRTTGTASVSTGNFAGTTDEILQWAACKWGIDEDIVRAQIAKESCWTMDAIGDNGESFGLGQVRDTVPPVRRSRIDNAKPSSAYNVDYTYSRWRSCYEGNETWLNQFERGGTTRPATCGDASGCGSRGRWYFNNADVPHRRCTSTSTTASGRRRRSSTAEHAADAGVVGAARLRVRSCCYRPVPTVKRVL